MTRSQPVAIDLFAGCGGMSHGLRAAGFQIAAAVEIDPQRARTYGLNHRGTHVFAESIRGVSAERIQKVVGDGGRRIDLIAGCPPCQGFSRIRRRNAPAPTADDRNDLIQVVADLVEQLRPKVVLLENVPGLEMDYRFESFIQRLTDCRYSLDWRIADLQDYGIPQRRRRLVLLASLTGKAPDLDRVRRGPRRTVGNTIRHLPHLSARARALHAIPEHRTTLTLQRIAATPRDGGSREAWPEKLRLDCHKRMSGFRDVYGRMAWANVAPTITGGCVNPSKGRFLHPTEDRAISVIEAGLLQTFPANYRFPIELGRTAIAEMIGEAVPPRFAERLGRYVARALLP